MSRNDVLARDLLDVRLRPGTCLVQSGTLHDPFTGEVRTLFANDPANLLAVEGEANQAKGHADAATWLPPHTAFRCDYVAAQVRVKASYGLWMTPAEHEASARVLETCG